MTTGAISQSGNDGNAQNYVKGVSPPVYRVRSQWEDVSTETIEVKRIIKVTDMEPTKWGVKIMYVYNSEYYEKKFAEMQKIMCDQRDKLAEFERKKVFFQADLSCPTIIMMI